MKGRPKSGASNGTQQLVVGSDGQSETALNSVHLEAANEMALRRRRGMGALGGLFMEISTSSPHGVSPGKLMAVILAIRLFAEPWHRPQASRFPVAMTSLSAPCQPPVLGHATECYLVALPRVTELLSSEVLSAYFTLLQDLVTPADHVAGTTYVRACAYYTHGQVLETDTYMHPCQHERSRTRTYALRLVPAQFSRCAILN